MARLETTDIFRGAFFLCKGGDLTEIRIRNNHAGRDRRNRIASFLFTGNDLARLDKDYRNGQALVNPVQFRESLNHLRDILFERLRDMGDTKNEKRYVEDPAKGGDRKRKDRGHQNYG